MQLEIEEFIDERSFPIAVPMSRHWAMDDGYFFTSLNAILSMSAQDVAVIMNASHARMQVEAADNAKSGVKPYRVNEGVAYIDMVGPMTKRPNCMAEMFGGGGASTMKIRQSLRAALRDDAVKSIMLIIESPGGEVNGAFDLASDVARANKIKPVLAYIEDMGASAAYLVASQAGLIYANANAVSGSIGVYQEVHDTSKAAENKGVKVHVIKAGEHKGIGVPGTEITESQLAVVQANTNKLHGLFLRAVSRGRNMDAKALARVADGGVFIGADGKRAGLIDNICTLDQAHSETIQVKRRNSPKGKQMAGITEEDVQLMLDNKDDDMIELDEDKVAAATVIETPVVAAAVPEQNNEFMAAAFALGIKDVNALQQLISLARIGEDYTMALRKQVGQLAVVAFGQADGPLMTTGVDGMNVDQLKAMSRQFSGIAESKGLIASNGGVSGRQTVAQDIAGGIQENLTGVGSETNEGKVAAQAQTDAVGKNRSNFNSTGLYSL